MNPPGRFLMKDPIRNVWHEIGDEKARDKTSQALRENALNVRKQMEEEIQEKSRVQQQQEAEEGGNSKIGVDRDGSKDFVDANADLPYASSSGGLPSASTGFGGYSYEAQQQQMHEQLKLPQQQSAIPLTPWGHVSHPPHGGQSQPPLHYPYSFPTAPQQTGMLQRRMDQQLQHQQQQHGVVQYYGGIPSSHSEYPQFIPNLQTNPPQQQPQQQNSTSQPIMLPPRVLSLNPTPPLAGIVGQMPLHPTLMPAPMRQSTLGFPSSTINPPQVPAMNDDDNGDDHHLHSSNIMGPPAANRITPLSGPYPPTTATNIRRSSLSSSRDSSPSDKHVQFQNDATNNPSSSSQRGSGNVNDIPQVINSNQLPPRNHPHHHHHHHHPSSSIQSSVSSGNGGQDSMSPPRSPTNNTSTASLLSQSTPATPLAFLSGDFSVKTSDSFSYYLKELEDEITGDVGQEVELVAHAPLFYDGRVDVESHHQYGSQRAHLRQQQQQQMQEQLSSPEGAPTHVHHPTRHHHGGIPSYSRSTPQRHHMSGGSTRSGSGGSGRRRKLHTGTHAPSNSGKVQLDLSTLGGVEGASSSTAAVEGGGAGESTPRASPPHPSTLPCGVMLTSPLRRSSSGLYRASMPCASGSSLYDLTPTSPVFSLDLDKMSLCGTENVSQMGGSIGGASLCNVFDDHEDNSAVGATLMDMTVSVGSQPSGGRSSGSSNDSPQSGLGLHHPAHKLQQERGLIEPQSLYDDSESLIGASSAIMDFSVGSVGMHSKEHHGSGGNNNDNESFIGVSSTGGAMDMSVGSNTHSKCQNSSSGSGSGGSLSRSSRRSGSPASIDKALV